MGNNYNNYNNNGHAIRKVADKIKGTSTFVKVILVIIIIIFVVLIIVWIVTLLRNKTVFLQNNPVLLSGEQDADTSSTDNGYYSVPGLPIPINGNLYSFSLWIYIEDYVKGLGYYKNIITRTNTDGSNTDEDKNDPTKILQSPGLYLDKENPNLIAYTSVIGGKPQVLCKIDNIPMNKWNHIAYILNTNSIDLYINGKLEKSCILDNVPQSASTDPLYMCKNTGFNGKIAQIQYFTTALTPDKVLDLYNKGPSGTNTFSIDSLDDKLKNINYDQLKSQICTGNQSLTSIISDNFGIKSGSSK